MKNKVMVFVMAVFMIVSIGLTNVKNVEAENDIRNMNFSLEEAKDYAIENSKDIKLTDIEIENANTQRRQQLKRIEDLEDAQDLANKGFIPMSMQDSLYGYDVEITKELTPDRLNMAIELAEKGKESTIEQTRLGVEKLYYEVKKMENLIDIQRESIERAKDQLKIAKSKLKNGVGTEVAVTMAEINLSDLEIELDNLNIGYNSARMNLNKLLGLPVNTELTLTSEVEFEKFKDIGAEEIVMKAYEDRMDMYQVKKKYEFTLRETEINKKFYDKYTYPYKYQQYNLNKAQINLDNKKTDIEIEVKLDLQKLNSLENEIKKYDNNIKKVEENLRIAKVKYENGLGILQDVLDAENTLKKAKFQKVTGIYSYMNLKGKLESYLE
ncbi:TolC family protein [Dethiothermospora halolimnae]|uniref:TolC family protein n=1 Tax=Dethiothermospora halolimnae TaxID=3114390 RepID=UPI003CCC1F7B